MSLLKLVGATQLRKCYTSFFSLERKLCTKIEIKNNDEPIDIKNPFEKEKAKCILCKMNIVPDYKNVKLLSQFQSPYTGRIYGQHITGLCKKKQEQVELEISRSQTAGYMPVYHKNTDFLHDPSLFDPERPVRPHKY